MRFEVHLPILIAVVGAAATLGCASDAPSRPTTEPNAAVSPDQGGLERPPTIHFVRGTRAGHDIFGRRIFAVGKQQFPTLPEFKAFIVSLPPGSIVKWNSGCIKYETIPLLESDMTIVAFKDYCDEHGVEFRFICGY